MRFAYPYPHAVLHGYAQILCWTGWVGSRSVYSRVLDSTLPGRRTPVLRQLLLIERCL